MYGASLPRFFVNRSFLLALFLASSVSAIHGQTTAQQGTATSTASSTTPIVTNVDEVAIDFVARNKKKKPVLDLKPEDLVITDNGSAVKVSALRVVAGKSSTDHLITLLFDALDPSAATNARDIARKILKLIPSSGFSFSVFNIDKRLRLVHEFTADRAVLQKAVSDATNDEPANRSRASLEAEKQLISNVQSNSVQPAVQTDAGQSESQPSPRAIEQALLASLKESQRVVQDRNIPASLAGLLALVRSQSPIRGRKLLIYFTLGLPRDADTRDVLRSIADAANRAEVSIYVINQTAVDSKLMEGLMATAAVGQVAATNQSTPLFPAAGINQVPQAFGPGLAASLPDTLARIEGEGLAGNGDPLGGLAANTGGAYIYSEDNLKKPFAHAVADLTTYYEASYVPPALDYNGEFRPVTVKTPRSGLKIQARAGYYAVPPTAGTRPFEVPLIKLLSEPQLPGDLKFRSAVLQLGNLATGNENTLVVEVPIQELETRSEPNANLLSWHVSMFSEVRNQSGAVVEHFSEDIPGHAALDAEEQAKLGCATMQRHFALPPGQYVLETAVADRMSGKLGGERVHFEIPGAVSGPFLSDVAMVRRIDSVSDELDPFEPLRYQHGKVVPSLSAQVFPQTKNISFFFVVSADSGISEPALLEMQVLRNGELLGQVPLQLPQELGQSFPYVASLKTDSLPAGKYDVRLSLAQGERIVERERSFSIAGPELANAAKAGPVDLKQEALTVSDSDSNPEEELPAAKRAPLVITSLPANSVSQPSPEELDAIIEGARKHALHYSEKLPNFLCVEVTDRSVDALGNGRWRRRDSFGELLRYVDNEETRTTLEVNGRASTVKRTDMNQWPISVGEFGDLLNLVFQPSSRAELHWKETDALGGGTVQVFDFRVTPTNNSMRLTDDRRQVNAGFHGMAYIDSATMGIRRITMEADDLPPDFSIHAASIAIDYDYVNVGAHQYLMPVRGTIRLKRGRREVDLNQIVFQDYRRYASQTKIIVKP